MNKKKLSKSLHRYRIIFEDGTESVIHGCGATNAYVNASFLNPGMEIASYQELPDSWKLDD